MIIDTRKQAESWLEFWQHRPPIGVLRAAIAAAEAEGDPEACEVLREAWERLYG